MKADILLLQALPPAVEKQMEALYVVHRLHQQGDPAAYVSQHCAQIRAVVTGGGLGIKNAMIDALPALEVITIFGVGTDAVDLEYARTRGVLASNTPDVLTDDVADLALGLMIATLRRMGEAERYVRSGAWGHSPQPGLARRVSGKQVGIVGLGRVGKAIARRLQGFGCAIRYFGPRPYDDVDYEYVADLVELARLSDVLVLSAAGDRAQGIIDATVLDALGPEGVLINVARGKVVDEAALLAALQTGRLGGAGLDVFADEPHVPAALLDMDQVVLQPHRGSATHETRQAMGELVQANLHAFFAGLPLPTRVV